MARVLVIEDEEVLLTAMVRALGKLPGVEALGAERLDAAIRILEEGAPDLIVSDLDLPERSGIEMIGELATRGMRIPIVFVSAYLKAYGAQIPPHADVRVLEKPVELAELRRIVRESVGGEALPQAGAPFGVVDYLQLGAMGRHSVVISTLDDAGGSGEIVIVRGELWSASDDDGSGPECFVRLVNQKFTSIQCETLTGEPPERNVTGSWEELVLEAARRADESGRSGDGEQDLGAALDLLVEETSAAAAEVPDGFGDAVERGLEALLAKDYAVALCAFREARAIRPEDRVVEANLARLRDLGFGEAEE